MVLRCASSYFVRISEVRRVAMTLRLDRLANMATSTAWNQVQAITDAVCANGEYIALPTSMPSSAVEPTTS